MKKIAFGAGCFWCSEASFSMLIGVAGAKSGYAGGSLKNPTYEQVCSGSTGHAEVVLVEYDDKKISLKSLLEVFFSIHDPTQKDRQGNDVGSQYRSIILYTEPAQKKEIEKFVGSIASKYPAPIATELMKLEEFYPAENYHDDYYSKNPLNPYCALVISPKIAKLRKNFPKMIEG